MASFNQTFDFANWDQAKFDKYRHIQDDYADKVAKAVIQSPHASQVFQALSKIVKNDDLVTINIFSDIVKQRASGGHNPHQAPPSPSDPPKNQGPHIAEPVSPSTEEEIKQYTDHHHVALVDLLNNYFNDKSLFGFVDTEQDTLTAGIDIFNFFYVHCTFALAVRSLMKQYAAYNATQVLIYTKLMVQYPYRRIMETVQFVMDVMDPLAFTPDGCGIRSIQKLRLVHAMIRARIDLKLYNDHLKPGEAVLPEWDTEAWGLAINQQDMIFAVHTFSVEIIDALIEINVFDINKPQDKENIEKYYLMWHHFGKALGVMDEINPMTYADGKMLQQKIYDKEFFASPSNVDQLVPPLVGFIDKLLSVNDNKKVYSVVKYYNRTPKDQAVFKDILHIDLNDHIDIKFYNLIRDTFRVLKGIILIGVAFVSKKDQKKALNDVVSLNHELLSKIIFVASDGQYYTGKHFRIGDGFGLYKPVVNYSKYKKQLPFFESLFKMILLKIWAMIKHFVKKLFKRKKKK